MSTLLKALRRADAPQHAPHIPAMGLPVTREEEPNRAWIWWLLAPLAIAMGAAANYGWHLLHNRPIEERVEVKEIVTAPFMRVEPGEMITRPLPPPLPEPVVQPKPVQEQVIHEPGNQDLAALLQSALNNVPLEPEPESAPLQTQSAASQVVPIAALPPALRQQIPRLAYGAHLYSSNPAKRSVVINGREIREGNEVAPGVILQAIAQDYIVLGVAGQSVSLKALQDWLG
ncbi:GspB family T2SS assembly factor variant ExeB [Aeromonas sp. BIGb0445]|jgi:general secretion pathway protein B|uniref:GspB family T2SS assembly factor variant ExeB n=1 Tax=Aeromonas sp. BIGb0445 TaxID=2940593 RepID=UPI0021681781|nr:GspB family T2SS assembly factor variant ExeB [Aeromonas sp. BIGb0445]MCS3460403.1 general secretion pathway protein B [Aeromonas sp. BIGb0445]